MKVELGPLPPPVMRPFVIGDVYDADQMRAYAQQEVAKERERCAKLCESVKACYEPKTSGEACAEACIALIRNAK